MADTCDHAALDADEDELLTTRQAAQLLGLRSPRGLDTVRAKIAAGKLEASRIGPGGHYRITRAAVQDCLCRVRPAALPPLPAQVRRAQSRDHQKAMADLKREGMV
jgi:excisionase family DNA binding protein